jgi:hypothetical protein
LRAYTIYARELSWPQRVLYAILGLVLLVLAFFFLTVALVAGALIALVVLARLWWISRKLRREAGGDALEGEYRVVSRRGDDEDRPPLR